MILDCCIVHYYCLTTPEHAVPPRIPPSIRCHLPYLLARAYQRQQRLFEAHTRDFDITGRDYGLLLMLESNPGLWQSEIADLMGLDRTTVTYLVDGLQKRGWVAREPDPADRRAHVVTMTTDGRTALESIRPAAAAAIDEVLAPLDETERDQLRALLTRLLGH